MKKLMTLMVGLAFLTGTVGLAFAQETTPQEPAKKEQKKGKKKGSKKKSKEEKQQPPAAK